MHLPKPHTLQTKFISGLIFATLVLGVVFSFGFYIHMRSVLEEEVHDKARLIFTHVDSIQHYVRDVLRPAMYDSFPEAFVLQAMSSSYISRKIMAPVNAPHDGTIYRRVAIDARNPDYEANEEEQQLIHYFRKDEKIELWQGYQLLDGEKYYIMSRPVRFDQQCMYCHGDPKNAPKDLLDRYGYRGFGKELGAIAGVDFVGISVNSSVGRVEQTILTYFACFALGALLFFFATNILFKILVVNNLKRLQNAFRKNVNEEDEVALLQGFDQGDEVEELVDSIEQMSNHLFDAKVQLQDYAENLRKMVADRTQALSREVVARREDVQLFVQILENMGSSRTRAELWRSTLPQICKRFKAQRIHYICTMGSQDSFVWPESEIPPEIPANMVDMLTGSSCVLQGAQIFVPVESSTGNAEGLLGLCWTSEDEAAQHDRNILLALGRQLGSSADNLTAIDNLLRQMNVLQTIVEGISDPLVLLDARCNILTVNDAARQLSSELSHGHRVDGNILPFFFTDQDQCPPLQDAIVVGHPHLREVTLAENRSFSLCLYPVGGRDGNVDRIVLYARETTTEKRMQAQVWHAEKMATVGKLTAGLAHEINNPLGVILCYTGLLRQTLTDSQQSADLEVIERHTRQAQRVLRDLLNFARPKAAGSGTADACAVILSIREVFSVQADKKGVQVQLEIPQEPLWVRMGIGELEQVMSNLMINALDAVPETKGKIRITLTTEDGEKVIVEVEDNGPGIALEAAPHIFDPFYSTKEIGAGTGLGLTVVYGMVSDLGGTIEIGRSEKLHGARFTIHIPQGTAEDEPVTARWR
ncbi:MAG: DUF3365 domain-containing protein [Desulfobulbus sp.]|nr:DUF3365 domain-containing protein [Desulfobulbus sp.]